MMPDEFNTNETLQIHPATQTGDCPLPEYLFGEFLHCVTNQVEHGAREINNV